MVAQITVTEFKNKYPYLDPRKSMINDNIVLFRNRE